MQQKITLKKELSIGDWLIVCSNLFAIYGVWMLNWDAKIIFLVFCIETIVIGVFNFLQLGLIACSNDEQGKKSKLAGGLFLMLFFLVHYSIFVFAQLHIFLSIMKIHKIRISTTELIFSFQKVMPNYALQYLGLFVASYFLGILKDFVFNGKYKTTSLTAQMFTPYKRIFIQQFVVILGAFVLLLNPNGKYLILLFVPIKIFFELFIDYDSLLDEMNKDI
jgi:hypothetical protein